MSLPRVAVVGRPNVGKSTLVNRLAEQRKSIVGPKPGLTRDRLDTEVLWRGRRFIVHDTGGVVEGEMRKASTATISRRVAETALRAVEGSDLVLFVGDVSTGITNDDVALARRLQKQEVPVLLVANKADNEELELAATELWGLGLGEPVPVSSTHGRGSGDLLDRIVEMLPEEPSEAEVEAPPAIAIVGRPNVGKSSLFNKIIGDERAIVHPEPGTTRDSIDSIVELAEKTYRFIDTAGIRRRARTKDVEIFSASRTRDAIGRADLAIVVVDAAEGATSQDQRIGKTVGEAGAAAIIALNKWDLVTEPDIAKDVETTMRDRLHFIDYAPMVRTSAVTARGVERLIRQIDPVLEARKIRVSTGRLNQLMEKIQQAVPPPRDRNRNVRILYATQSDVAPPTFVLFSTGRLATTWLRYVERKLREEFGFLGTPLKFVPRLRSREATRRG